MMNSIISVLLVISTVLRATTEATDACPAGDGLCITLFDPVLCGDCEYSNSCFAASAGFNVDADCVSKDEAAAAANQTENVCPSPDSATVCTFVFLPVKCDGLCDYPNSCTALSAGYNESSCCPLPDPEYACIALSDPIKCGQYDCEYSNKCFAELARFNTTTDCTSLTKVEDTAECPTPDTNILCNFQFDPVTCGDCQYTNSCVAGAAGFVFETDCTKDDQVSGTICPTPSSETVCAEIFSPVTCGDCEYSNSCKAEAAGFTVATDCNDDADTESPTGCPLPDEGIVCTGLYSPYFCGDCQYSNSCVANAAGFDTDSDCIPDLACPVPDIDVLCTTSFAPVTCNNCEYSNDCLAEAAGFVVANDCTTATFLCFSGSSLVTVKDKGLMPLQDIVVGDEVLVDSNEYEKIYTFGHRDTTQEAVFLKFLPSGLELTEDHMIFVDGKGPIPASMVKIGDRLSDGQQIERIQNVVRTGVYGPFTPSGTIIVNGVKASNYIVIQKSKSTFFLGDFNTGFTLHWIAHSFMFPYRVWSYHLGFEDPILENGLSRWCERSMSLGAWYFSQNMVVMGFLLVPLVAILEIFASVESVLSYPGVLIAVIAVLSFAAISRRQQSKTN